MKILSVVGARPNFMKIAPFTQEIEKYNHNNVSDRLKNILVHTGQHYDGTMSQNFFRDLNIPKPDINLEIGSGTHAEQVGQTMVAFEKVLQNENPEWVVVVGDVNATLACSITAKKENIKVCHIEAGLRSRDLTMPEEINRIVTDRLSDLLLTPDIMSSKNLIAEGVPDKNITFVGNIMVDSLEANRDIALELKINSIIEQNLFINKPILLPKKEYVLLTMHRPANVDNKNTLSSLIEVLIKSISKKIPLVWPMQPRTVKQLKKLNLFNKLDNEKNIILLKPVSYHQMLKLNMGAKVMLTDSGGLQEECSVLGTPCLTLRENTERPITLRENGGTSVLVGNDVTSIIAEFNKILLGDMDSKVSRPKFWDGQTAQRCLDAIINYN